MAVVHQTLRFTRDHTWVRFQDGTVRVGLTDVLTQGLAGLTEVGLPALGSTVRALAPCGFLATPTWFGDLFAPLSGLVCELNDQLAADPGLVVREPYGAGWLFELRPTGGPLPETLDGPDYLAMITQAG